MYLYTPTIIQGKSKFQTSRLTFFAANLQSNLTIYKDTEMNRKIKQNMLVE